ncbi:linoleoyl-CoA desaturase [Planctomycetaceae bacterium SCGC AG-212-F19]|nr:linoleoyl-CoA desaturase [Planctomycetaceae bacterium SCGC AG-212-F19]
MLSNTAPGKPKFALNEGFHNELRERVDGYFQSTGQHQRGSLRMYVKAAIIFSWLAASYVLLVFVAQTWWHAVPLALSLVLAMAAVGFNIQHDGGHQAFSDHRWINKLMALSLDLLGASSYVWACKHNLIHHSYTNITGVDDDIDLGFVARVTPHQKRLRIHRMQHLYLWALYGFQALKWQLVTDFWHIATGRIGGHRLPRPQGWDLVTFIGGKVVFWSLAFVIPLLLHPFWVVLLFYAGISFLLGVVISVVFQLAHCVEEAAFPLPRPDTARMETDWAAHQVATTVDFARGSRVVSWFVGGLNFQIEHHLFPRICHIHYRAISKLVEQTCTEFGMRYVAMDTVWGSLASHYRWLRRMGLPSPS